jgi:hypothetical protein
MAVNKIGITLVSIAILTNCYCGSEKAGTMRQVESIDSGVPSTSPATSSNTTNDKHIQNLITFLSSNDEDERSNAQIELISLAGESSQTRKAIIDELILSVQRLNIENRMILDTKNFHHWSSVCQIFGKLEATEAIDLLIRYIYWNNGMASDKSYNRPAEGALAQMWPASFPKLFDALVHNDKQIIRGRIALLLGSMGGPNAKQALEQAIKTEADKGVLYNIKLALATIARESS